jgi:hypothetical protein
MEYVNTFIEVLSCHMITDLCKILEKLMKILKFFVNKFEKNTLSSIVA